MRRGQANVEASTNLSLAKYLPVDVLELLSSESLEFDFALSITETERQ